MYEDTPEDYISRSEGGGEHGGRMEEFCNGHIYTLLISATNIRIIIYIRCIYSHNGVSIRRIDTHLLQITKRNVTNEKKPPS